MLVRDVLEVANYDVVEALSGAYALEIVVDEQPDLILLDVNMPVMDGFEVCRILKSEEATHNIPVIRAISGITAHFQNTCFFFKGQVVEFGSIFVHFIVITKSKAINIQ